MRSIKQLGYVFRIPRTISGLDGTADVLAQTAEEAVALLEKYAVEHPDVEMKVTGPAVAIAGDVWG